VRHGARAARGHRRGRPEPRARGHDPALLGEPGPDRARARAGDGRDGRPGAGDRARPHRVALDPARPLGPGRALGRLAVLCARRAVAAHAQPQHVHAHRAGHRRCVRLQRVRGAVPRRDPARDGAPRHARGVLRGGGRHHDARPPGPGTGAAGSQRHVRGDSRSAGPSAQDRPARSRGRQRGGRAAGARGRGRSAAGPAGRARAGGRRAARGPERGGRVDGDR